MHIFNIREILKFFRHSILFLVLVVPALPALAADYYAVANGSWSNVNTWATGSCGGAPGAGVPGAGDNVYLTCSRNINLTANSGSSTMQIFHSNGQLDLSTFTLTTNGYDKTGGTTIGNPASGYFAAQGTARILGPASDFSATFEVGGNLNLTGEVQSSGIFRLGAGNFSSNGYDITANDLEITGGAVNMTGSKLTITGDLLMTSGSYSTTSANQEIILSGNFTYSNGAWDGAAPYPDLILNGAGNQQLFNAFADVTLNNFKINYTGASRTVTLDDANQWIAMTSFRAYGMPSNPLALNSDGASSSLRINSPGSSLAESVNCTNVNSTINNTSYSGGSISGCTGWVAGAALSVRYYRASGNWSTPGNWRDDCAGSGPGGVPAPTDHVVICSGITVNLDGPGGTTYSVRSVTLEPNANIDDMGSAKQIEITGQLAGASLRINSPSSLGNNGILRYEFNPAASGTYNLDMTGVMATNVANQIYFAGTNASTFNIENGPVRLNFQIRISGNTLNTNGNEIFINPGGGDALAVYAGSTVNLSNSNVTLPKFYMAGGTVNADTSNITFNSDFEVAGGTFNAGTGTVTSTNPGIHQIPNAVNFYNLSLNNNGTFEFGDANTYNVTGNFTATGISAASRMTIKSIGGAPFNFNLTGSKGAMQYLDVSNSNASGSSGGLKPLLSAAGPDNLDSGGNTDWFPPTRYLTSDGDMTSTPGSWETGGCGGGGSTGLPQPGDTIVICNARNLTGTTNNTFGDLTVQSNANMTVSTAITFNNVTILDNTQFLDNGSGNQVTVRKAISIDPTNTMSVDLIWLFTGTSDTSQQVWNIDTNNVPLGNVTFNNPDTSPNRDIF